MPAFDASRMPAWRQRFTQSQCGEMAQPSSPEPNFFDMSYDDVYLTDEEAVEVTRVLENGLSRPLHEISEAHVIVE